MKIRLPRKGQKTVARAVRPGSPFYKLCGATRGRRRELRGRAALGVCETTRGACARTGVVENRSALESPGRIYGKCDII